MTARSSGRRLPAGSGRTIALLAVTGIAVPALAAGILGMPAVQALMAGAIGVALVALWGRPPQAADITFPIEPKPQRNRGTRREAFQLSWSVAAGNDQVGAQLIIRIQRIAGCRLATQGLTLSDPADRDRIVSRVGERAYQTLATPPGLEISRREFQDALAAVENLGPAAGARTDNVTGKDHR